MPKTFVLLSATVLLIAQPAPFLIGHITAVSRDQIEVSDGTRTQLLFFDSASHVWRGKDYRDFSAPRVGDGVNVKYRMDAASRAVVLELAANLGKVEGRITRVDHHGFQVDENYNADPRSGYRRGLRDIVYNSDTQWEQSVAEDLRDGRDVFVMGLKLAGGELKATQVTVYEGHRPVRMKPGTRVISPDGTVH